MLLRCELRHRNILPHLIQPWAQIAAMLNSIATCRILRITREIRKTWHLESKMLESSRGNNLRITLSLTELHVVELIPSSHQVCLGQVPWLFLSPVYNEMLSIYLSQRWCLSVIKAVSHDISWNSEFFLGSFWQLHLAPDY